MDLKTLATVFGIVFLAELGDKTQLATLLFASKSPDKLFAVFVGASAAPDRCVCHRRGSRRRYLSICWSKASFVCCRSWLSADWRMDDLASCAIELILESWRASDCYWL